MSDKEKEFITDLHQELVLEKTLHWLFGVILLILIQQPGPRALGHEEVRVEFPNTSSMAMFITI